MDYLLDVKMIVGYVHTINRRLAAIRGGDRQMTYTPRPSIYSDPPAPTAAVYGTRRPRQSTPALRARLVPIGWRYDRTPHAAVNVRMRAAEFGVAVHVSFAGDE